MSRPTWLRWSRLGRGVVATLPSGTTIGADVVLIGIGTLPNTELAQAAGLDIDGGILVGRDQRTSHPRVFAVGDAARQAGPDGPLPRIEHWHGAGQSGQRAAASILGTTRSPVAPWFWSDRYDTHLEMVGEAASDADVVVRGRAGDPAGFSVFFVRGSACVGAVTVNRPLDCRAAQRLIDRGIAVDASALADEAHPLRDLIKA